MLDLEAMSARGEQQMREGRKRRAEWVRRRSEWSQIDLFCPVALGDWLSLCWAAKVAAVPAVLLGSYVVDDILEYETPGDETRRLEADLAAAQKRLGAGYMARWDCCSMAEVKYRLSEGMAEWNPTVSDLYVGDLRAFDLIYDFPRSTIKAWMRPWTQFAIESDWPIEYRAFVHDGALIGVSNYYPQRPLPASADTERDLATIMLQVEALISAQTRPMLIPQLSDEWNRSLNQWTADFARLPSGAIVFLEGGPPHSPTGSAHSCCFEPGKVEGFALEARWDCS